MSETKPQGLAVLCDKGGLIRKVIVCSEEIEPTPREGMPFAAILTTESFRPAMSFLLDLSHQQVVCGRQLEIGKGERRRAYQFSGGTTPEGLLIIGAPSDLEFERLYVDLSRINNEQANLVRQLLKNQGKNQQPDQGTTYEEMTRLNNDLGTLQRELSKSNSQLISLNEQKNQLLGMAAHDLRNPLTVIMAYAKFLKHMTGDRLQENEMKFVEQILTSSQFMLRMLEDLLDVSQIESGKLLLKTESFDFTKLVQNNIKLNSELARQKRIFIDLTLPEAPIIIYADPGKLEQVLNNLVSNAIKFSQSDTRIRVEVSINNGAVITRVFDQGQGIPRDELGHLFKPFSKTSAKTTAGEKSTGLGLLITKKIVEGHGGHVFVDSEIRKGSTFGFDIPLSMPDGSGMKNPSP